MALRGQRLQRHDGSARGQRLLSDEQVEQWQHLLESRAAWLNVQGIPYFFVIAPDAHAVYADMLPEGIVPGATRPALQVLERLRERDSWAPVCIRSTS